MDQVRFARPTSRRIFLIAVLACCGLFGLICRPARGQEVPPDWDEPVNISNSASESESPSLAADSAGNVRVVWTEREGQSEGAVFYACLEKGVWTAAVDVLVTPGGDEASNPVLAADARGYLHVVWVGGGNIYYSYAYAPAAHSAQGWSEPRPLIPVQRFVRYVRYADLVVGEAGGIYVVYTEQIGSNSGVYIIRSPDGGNTWQYPVSIYSGFGQDHMVDHARVAIGLDGVLHVVWVDYAYPETFPPLGIRYAYSSDGGATWSEPISLADGPYDWPDLTVNGDQEVHVVWSGTDENRFKFHRWSADNGQSWSSVWRNEELGGYQGWPALVVDGSQNLHWLQVGTIFSANDDELYYNAWVGGRWSPGNVLLRDPVSAQNQTNVSAAVALGNELHVVVQTPFDVTGGDRQFDILYLHRSLDIEGWAAQPLAEPTLVPATAVTPSPAGTILPVPQTPVTVFAKGVAESTMGSTVWYTLAISALPAVLVVGFVVVIYIHRSRNGGRG